MLLWFTLILGSPVQAWTCATPANPALGQAVVQAAQGLSCPQGSQRRQVHMTFDDGPSSASTPTILNELNRISGFVFPMDEERCPRISNLITWPAME
jgi:hypothetical protein